jgi:fucose permease
VALPHARPKGTLLQTPTEALATPDTSRSVLAPVVPGTATNRTVTTAFDPSADRRANSARVVQAIYLGFGVIVGLLLIRFFLRALDANGDAGFAQAIYAITGMLVAPFSGLFGTPQLATGAALEISTLLALIVYAGVGWIVARAAWLIFGDAPSSSLASLGSKRTLVG